MALSRAADVMVMMVVVVVTIATSCDVRVT